MVRAQDVSLNRYVFLRGVDSRLSVGRYPWRESMSQSDESLSGSSATAQVPLNPSKAISTALTIRILRC